MLVLLNMDDGNLYIAGSLTAQQTVLADDPNTPELVIKDAQGAVLALIDVDGDLQFRGRLYENYNPCWDE